MANKVKADVRRRREEAEDRQRHYNGLTLEQKLAKLDRVPGASQRERARLTKQITEAQQAS